MPPSMMCGTEQSISRDHQEPNDISERVDGTFKLFMEIEKAGATHQTISNGYYEALMSLLMIQHLKDTL